MALSGFLKSGKVCFSDFGTRTFVMFRLIPGIFGHAKIMLSYFRTSNIISNVIGCNFMYSLFNIHSTFNHCHHFCLHSIVYTVHCLISIELPAVCSSREDGCSILSLGRGLVNLASRERIGQSFPACKDTRQMHPCRMEQIDSVKINPSLVMMRE